MRTRAHVIADLSVNHLERFILRNHFSADRPTHDYGVDLVMHTYSAAGEIENGWVEFQLKATGVLRPSRDGHSFPFRVDLGDIQLWRWQPNPVILVIYEGSKDRAFWLSIQEYVESGAIEDIDNVKGRQTVTVRVPAKNRITMRSIQRFRESRDAVLALVKGVIGYGG